MKKIMFLLFCLPIYATGLAQEKPSVVFVAKAVDYQTDQKIQYTTLFILKNNKPSDTILIDSTGKSREILLDFDVQYKVTYFKEGYVKRSVVIDTRNYPMEKFEKNQLVVCDMRLMRKELVQKCSARLSGIENVVSSTLHYNATVGAFDWDMKQFETYKSLVNPCMK